MKYLKQISSIALSMMFFFANSSSGSAQDWPDPLVELVSINSDASSYFTDGKIKFNLSINRINGSTYSDITRVWICPKPSWDGFMCNSGQFLVSTTPSSLISQFTIESPVLTLADGEYLITGVSFRNGAVITGFTLMYPRTGVVTIGGIATTIGLVNLAAADFVITTPAPEPVVEPEPEPIVEPDPIPEPETSATESESATNTESTTEPTTEPETSPDTEPSASDGAEPPATEEASTESGTESEPTSVPTTETTTEPAAADSTQSGDAGSGDNESESSAETESTPEPAVTEPEETETPAVEPEASTQATNTGSNQPTVNQPTVIVQPVVTQPVITQPETTSSTTEIKTLTPNVAGEIKPETALAITESIPTALPAMKRQLITAGAIGGKVLQVTGEAKLIRSVTAGIGRLKLIGSNDSILLVKLGSRVVTQVNLAKDQVISWRSNRPAKLKLILSGDSAELNIDALQLNVRLIANPSFQMRS